MGKKSLKTGSYVSNKIRFGNFIFSKLSNLAMKKLTIILTLLLLGNIFEMNSQNIQFNRLKNPKYLKLKDTLTIDLKKGGAFHNVWQKLVIIREKEKLQLIKIDNITELILKYDKTLVLSNSEENWLKNNFNKVFESVNKTRISKEEYISIIDKINDLILTYKNCKTNIAGKYSKITISMNNIKEVFDFNCEIHANL
ncbi:hypothetical protein T190607A01A_20557 [Tenacibaculum sp. 190524A05c]|uniref:Intein n=2 Tax=Tenacibaculum platacis TaxID=3137852 RepID=A0ABP1EMB0_9FLAO